MVPNGQYLNTTPARAAAYISKLKAMGFRNGVSDIVIALPMHGYHGAYVEMKSGTGTATTDQKDWLRLMWRAGYWATVSKGFVQAKEDVELYLAGEKPRPAIFQLLDI